MDDKIEELMEKGYDD